MARVAAWSENSTNYIYIYGASRALPPLPPTIYIYILLNILTTVTTIGTLRPYGAERSVARSVAGSSSVAPRSGFRPHPSKGAALRRPLGRC